MDTAESATLQRIQTLWYALKCQVRKLPDSNEWNSTIEEVERRIKSTGDRILSNSARHALLFAETNEPPSARPAESSLTVNSKPSSPSGVKKPAPGSTLACQEPNESAVHEEKNLSAPTQAPRVNRKRLSDSVPNDDVRSLASVPSLAASRIIEGTRAPTSKTGQAAVRSNESVQPSAVTTRSQAPQSQTVPVYDIISVDSSVETQPLPSLSKSINSRRVHPVTVDRNDDLLADHELDRLMNKGPAPKPITSPHSNTLMIRESSTSANDVTKQRSNINAVQTSKAVQFELQDSDDDLISLQRSKRRGRNLQKQDDSIMTFDLASASPQTERAATIQRQKDCNCHEEPLILSSKFFPMRDGMQEYLRVTLRDCRSVRRHSPQTPSEYIMINDSQLLVLFEFAADELPPLGSITPTSAGSRVDTNKSPARSLQVTPSSSGTRRSGSQLPNSEFSSPEKRRLALPLAPRHEQMDELDDDESFLLSAQRKTKNSPPLISPASRTGKSTGKKRKKNSTGKESKRSRARRKKYRQAFPYIADQRTTSLTRDRFATSDELFPDDALGDDMYQVDAILDVMQDCRDKKMYFYVKWKDYDDDDNTWEPEENLEFGDHSARINYLKALHEEKLRVSEAIVREENITWRDFKYSGKYRQDFNDYMKSFIVSEQDKRETGMLEPFCVQARQWCHPQPPVGV